jgi:hypothetical protein
MERSHCARSLREADASRSVRERGSGEPWGQSLGSLLRRLVKEAGDDGLRAHAGALSHPFQT